MKFIKINLSQILIPFLIIGALALSILSNQSVFANEETPKPTETSDSSIDDQADSESAVSIQVVEEITDTVAISPTATIIIEPTNTPTLVPPTETPTLIPTETSTPLPTETPTVQIEEIVSNPDFYEPNNSVDQATTIILNEIVSDLTLDPLNDIDYFRIYVKAGQLVEANTYVYGGLDTKMSVFTEDNTFIDTNDDRSVTDIGSRVRWEANTEGWYFIVIDSAIPMAKGDYQLEVLLQLPDPTATPSPTATLGPTSTPAPTSTPIPTATPPQEIDAGEPNNEPENAFGIIPGEVYYMTLGPVGYDSHDFFYMLGKAGVSYTCEAINPQGVDPTIRVYIGEVGAGILIAENDDISETDIGSRVWFNITDFDMGVYIVVEDRIGSGSYDFSCYAQESSWTGGGGSTHEEAQPWVPAEPIDEVIEEIGEDPFEEPIDEIEEDSTSEDSDVTEEDRSNLIPLSYSTALVPEMQEEPTITTVEIIITYDQNNNRNADSDEGIPNVSIRALDGNEPVGWAITNEQGRATMTLSRSVDTVVVPFLSGWNYRVRQGELNTVTVEVPAITLPVIMPILNTAN
ncbi:MAG: hypothetical protein AAGD96_01470 [Chloroflexota bacterium]